MDPTCPLETAMGPLIGEDDSSDDPMSPDEVRKKLLSPGTSTSQHSTPDASRSRRKRVKHTTPKVVLQQGVSVMSDFITTFYSLLLADIRVKNSVLL